MRVLLETIAGIFSQNKHQSSIEQTPYYGEKTIWTWKAISLCKKFDIVGKTEEETARKKKDAAQRPPAYANLIQYIPKAAYNIACIFYDPKRSQVQKDTDITNIVKDAPKLHPDFYSIA